MISRTSRELPIDRHERAILYSLERNQILIVVGDTGSGKSTRLPRLLFSAGSYNKKIPDGNSSRCQLICITQPRRIAAIQLAQRVSQDLGCDLGTTVGYAIRFKDVTDPEHTMIKYLTEGILIREMISDPLLRQYSVIIVDEAHERSLSTDLLLGLLKCTLLKRPELRVMICSATLDVNEFVKFYTYSLGSVKYEPTVITIDGRSHQVEIFNKAEPVANYLDSTIDTVINIHESVRLSSGKILVFLTGIDEIEYVCVRLQEYAQSSSSRLELRKLIVLQLHASLGPEAISKVFGEAPRNSRVCIVSTNVAETSLTIDDVAFVVDCGFVKLKVFDPKSGIDSLIKVPISKSSANQRAGRAGRTREGKVYRLYSQQEYEKLIDKTIPEIQRSSLSEAIMVLKSMGVDNITKFPLISRMPRSNLVSALEVLYALEAIDDHGQLTSAGNKMAQFNLDPMYSKILIDSSSSLCSIEACRIVSLLQVKDIFTKPGRHMSSLWSNQNLISLCASEGDIISYLNLLESFVRNQKSQRWAEKRNLNHLALLSALDIASKLERQLKRMGREMVSANGRLNVVQKCVIAGLFLNSAYLHGSGDYRTIKGDQIVYIHPQSVFSEMVDRPKYMVFGEILNTTRPYMRHLMAVDKDLLLESAPRFFTFQAKI